MGGDNSGGEQGETSGGGTSADGGTDGVGGSDDGDGGTDGGGSGGDDSGTGGDDSGTGGDDPGTGGDSGTGGTGSGGTTNGSVGCGTSPTLESGDEQIDVDGTPRDYVLHIPANYDEDKAYSLIFGFHANGGDGPQVASAGYFGLEPLANDTAIFVAPTGLDPWADSNGRDIAMVQAITAHLEAELCVDQDRIFAVGFSAGAIMAYNIGCELSDTFRAIGSISGMLTSACGGTGSVAVWASHGDSDSVILPPSGQDAIDEFRARNGCSTDSSAVEPSPCIAYEGCDAGYPVHYCIWSGVHAIPPFAEQGIWNFFEALEPK